MREFIIIIISILMMQKLRLGDDAGVQGHTVVNDWGTLNALCPECSCSLTHQRGRLCGSEEHNTISTHSWPC